MAEPTAREEAIDTNAVTAGQLSNTSLQLYMDPYTQDVINATMPGMIQANALSQNVSKATRRIPLMRLAA